jgi:hypothetical protein
MRVVGFVGDKGGKASKRLLQALNGRLPQLTLNSIITGDPDGIPDRDAGQAAYSFQRSLRELLDKWIDSGKTGDGEFPLQRSSFQLPETYVRRNPPALSMDAEGPYLILVPWKEGKSFAASVIDGALAIFVQFLDSPECRRLFRCDGCGTYFMRVREPKKDTPIKRGSWCAKCKGKGGSRRTDESRKNRKDERVQLAAEVWEQWKRDRRHGERAEWVARKINERLPSGRNHIAKNWVTRHTKEIEAEVERRNHATR